MRSAETKQNAVSGHAETVLVPCTLGWRRQSGSEFQTVAPAVVKARLPKLMLLKRLILDDDDRRHRRREHSDRRGMLALGSEDNDERSPPVCTPPAGVRPASAGRHEAAVTVHVRTCRCWRSSVLQHSVPAATDPWSSLVNRPEPSCSSPPVMWLSYRLYLTFKILSLFPLVQPGHSYLLADASKLISSSSLIRRRRPSLRTF